MSSPYPARGDSLQTPVPTSRIARTDAARTVVAHNATVLLTDYAVGFASQIRSHDMREHLTAATGLARLAVLYGAPVVVPNGEESRPSGPLYPELLHASGSEMSINETCVHRQHLNLRPRDSGIMARDAPTWCGLVRPT